MSGGNFAFDADNNLNVNVVVGGGSSGGLTDTQLRATPVPVSGPLTDTQLRAAAVPVSGSITVSGGDWLTDTQLRATAVPVSGTFFQITQPVSGPLTDTQLRASSVPIDYAITTVALLEKLLEEIQAMRGMLTHVVCESGEAFPGDFSVYLNGFNDSQTVIE